MNASVQAQGTLREIVADSYFQRNGYTALDGKCGSGNCFDGVYVKGNSVYINEVKPLNADGTIKLTGPSGNQQTQMSDAWIQGAVKRLKEGTPLQKATAEVIAKALDPEQGGSLVKVVTGVNSNGMTIIKLK
jgi:filamentous hemagglutinin